jgi:hypothetical protein
MPVYRYQAVRIKGKGGTVGTIAYFTTRQGQRDAIRSGEFAPIRSTAARQAMRRLRAAAAVTLGG